MADAAAERLCVADEVAAALASGQAVVALESTIISHGMPFPQNVEAATAVEEAVRDRGAVPATIAILEGRIRVGLSPAEIRYLGRRGGNLSKCSRRDLPIIIARGEDGATTVAATMIIASMAGIRVFATGGIGGVHRDGEQTLDISADLDELARTDVTVVCAGIKSVLDLGRSLEYLETRGVPVLGFGTDELPAFYARSSGFPVAYRVDSADEVAAAMAVKRDLSLAGGLVVAVPIPAEHALDPDEIEGIIVTAIGDMHRRDISGKAVTPFLLERISDRTGGRSLAANIALVINNACVAADIATALQR